MAKGGHAGGGAGSIGVPQCRASDRMRATESVMGIPERSKKMLN